MKRISTLLLTVFASAAVLQAQHLMFTEIVMQPLGAEYVKIRNAGTETVNLGNYYLTDGIDNAGGKAYYNLPSGDDYWSGLPDDFIARFPADDLAPGEEIFVAAYSPAEFQAKYGMEPHYALLSGGMLNAEDGVNTIGSFTFIGRFDTGGESLVLFYWDGSSATVKDVDYLVWGNSSFAVDKTGVSGYAADTPAASQSILAGHLDEQKMIRSDFSEGAEPTTGGNGITGHDETGEDLLNTWTTTALIFPKPKINDLAHSPATPSNKEDITFSATVTDSVGLSSVILTTIAGTDTLLTDMTAAGDVYSAVLNFRTSATDKVSYYVTAVNSQGFSTVSTVRSVTLLVEVAIITIQQNLSTYLGKVVNVSGLVISRADNIGGGTNLLLDDGSGTITVRIWNSDNILVGASGLVINEELDALLQFGNRIRLTATVGEYNGDAQLVPSSADDFSEFTTGSEGEGKLVLNVAPYPFVPQLGEVIRYSVEYPDNARVVLRVYDMAGRYYCTLMDEHHGLSWQFEDTWNGRDEFNHLLPPGKYLMVLESTNLATAEVQKKMAPVVIAVKF